MATLDIKVPDIGDFADVAVIELMVKVGDTIKVDQSLLTVESDKASMEIPSSNAGVVTAFLVKLGDKVNAAARKALEDPAVRKRIEDTGSVVLGNTPEQFAQQMKEELAVYRKVVQSAKLKLE